MLKKLCIFIALLICLHACTRGSNDNDTLNMNLGTEPRSLDWNLANDYASFDVIGNLMVGLTRFSTGINPNTGKEEIISIPACAQSWEIENQNTKYIFHLDPRAKWTDGKQVIAQDFVNSIKRILNPKTAAPYADLISIIDQAYAKDPLTLVIELKKTAPYFIHFGSYGLMLPIRQDLIDKYGDDWTEPGKLVSNGAYKLASWQHEYKIVLERNEDFELEPKPSIKYLKYFMVAEQSSAFTLYKNQEFDWIDGRSIPNSEYRNLNQNDKHEIIKQFPLLRTTYIGFNHSKAPFDNADLRKAFAHAVDRANLVKILARGHKASGTLIPASLSNFYNEDRALHFDPKLAKQYLQKYLSQHPKPTIKFLFPSSEESKLLSETLQAMWTKYLNIEVELVAMEWKVFLDTLKRDPPGLFRLNWGADYPDPDSFMQLFSSNNAINYGRWKSPKYDKLVSDAASTDKIRSRQELYERAEKLLLAEEVAIIPLFVNQQTIIQRTNLEGLEINPMDIAFLTKVKKHGDQPTK